MQVHRNYDYSDDTVCRGRCEPSCVVASCHQAVPCHSTCATHSRNVRPAVAACSTLHFPGLPPATGVLVPGKFAWTERYPNIERCHGRWFLTTRRVNFDVSSSGRFQVNLMQTIWRTLQEKGGRTRLGRASPMDIPEGPLVAANAAVACLSDNHTLAAFGGVDHRWRSKRDLGVRRSVIDVRGAGPGSAWSEARPVLRGSQEGCQERRDAFRGHGCEFDGKLSLVRHHDGALLLYTRANMAPAHGARHAQVARSEDDGLTWSRFEMLQFDGYNITDWNNIYYFHVVALQSWVPARFLSRLDRSPGRAR